MRVDLPQEALAHPQGRYGPAVARVFLVVVLALACAPAVRAAEPIALDAGGLRAVIQPDPLRLELVDTADGDTLRLGDGGGRFTGLGYGFDLRQAVANNAYFGYEVSVEAQTAWFHATRLAGSRVVDGRLVLVAETDDPLGHRLEIVLERIADGVVRIRSRVEPGSGPLAGSATAFGAAFASAPGERFLGFGSRNNAVDQTGRSLFNWAEEGPFSAGDYEGFFRRTLPEFVFPTGPAATNFPIPWTVTTRGLGLLVESTERSTFDLSQAGAWRVQAEAPDLELVVVAGPKPADVVRRYSAWVGRQPRPAGWIFGPWVQFAAGRDKQFVQDDVPTSVSQTYAHYLPCGAQGKVEDERRRVQQSHDLGMKITTYFNPHVCTTYSKVYDDASAKGLFVKNPLGSSYLLTNPFTADQIVSEIDFSIPAGRALYARLLDEALDAGYDGWMEDFGEYTPTDAVLGDGTRGLESHNRYPVLYHCASTEHTRKRRGADLAVFIRSGYHGVQPCARVVWGADPTEDWSCSDGLCAAVNQLLNVGLSGIAYQGSDIGGFHAIANGRTSDELNARWLEVGFASGVMRTQANGYSFRNDRATRSQVWSDQVLPVWRRYAKLRTQLFPYIAAASAQYQRTGMPIARHLALVWPEDRPVATQHDAFLFGPDLLVAPVLAPNARERKLRLPAGEWIDLWRSAAFDSGPGALALGAPALLSGGRGATLPAPLQELPMLVRAGAVLPLTSPDVDTLATLGDERTVSLHERRGRLTLLAWPRGTWTGTFYGRGSGRLVSRETRRGWELRVVSKRRRTVTLQAALRSLRKPLRPRRVTIGGKRVRSWSYDRATGVLRARFAVRNGTLRVS
jgi:alpha-glucosidase (family GH31 glycosyl hydrolase)